MLDRVSSYNGDAVDGVAPTKDEGDLERGLTPSMISMIALGGAIGVSGLKRSIQAASQS